ncbi:hypothetical protein F4604DRAFT_1935161 [Suillus subluteus]|nr:hypothetical protein F4604DRAFT_1935161 [Suillus subluteus]
MKECATHLTKKNEHLEDSDKCPHVTSNADSDATLKERKEKKANVDTSLSSTTGMDTTPTRESFSTATTSNTSPPASKEHASSTKTPATVPTTPNGPPPHNETSTPNTIAPQPPTVSKVTSVTTSKHSTKTTKPKSLNLQGEILKGVQMLDNGLKLTAPPLGGFHIPQLCDSVWNNIPANIQARWSQKPGAKVWARLFRAQYEENAQVMVTKIRNVIMQLILAPRAENLLISPPTAEVQPYISFTPPWHFLVSGILVEAINTLTNLAICTTSDVTCFFLPFDQPLPSYICTIKNLMYQDSDKSNLLIAELVKTTLLNSPAISDFINKHITAPDASAVKRALDSICITSLNITTSKTSSFTIWNVYCDDSPRFSLEDYFMWSSIIRGLRFPSDDYRTGVPCLQEKQFLCLGCKSLDHPTGLCPLPNTPGWLGPSNAAPKEDLSMTTFNALSPGKNNSSKHPNSRGGTNRGWGSRGRGRNGFRGGRGSPSFSSFKP